MSKVDYGQFLEESNAVMFRSRSSHRFIPVENMAQGARGFIEQFFGDPVSVSYSEIQGAQRPRMMVHEIVRHRDLALRAHQISKSSESASAEANWLRAERELLPGSGD